MLSLLEQPAQMKKERLRLLYTDDFDVSLPGFPKYSKPFHSLYAALHHDLFVFTDMTEHDDTIKVTRTKVQTQSLPARRSTSFAPACSTG